MNTIYQSLKKTLSYGEVVMESSKVLLMAATDVFAIQVNGTTITTVLGIPIGDFGTKLLPLYGKMKCSLRTHLSDLKSN